MVAHHLCFHSVHAPHFLCDNKLSLGMDNTTLDAWDQICINPHQSQIAAGRQEGHEAGLQAGFKDGFALGRTKGIEFGIELGFISGVLNTVETKFQSNQDDEMKNERLLKKVAELRRAIDEFPSPDTMFEATAKVESDDNEGDDSEGVTVSKRTDIMRSMQRIRAKFKALCAQLRVCHHSLKQVMDSNRIECVDVLSNEKTVNDLQHTSSEW